MTTGPSREQRLVDLGRERVRGVGRRADAEQGEVLDDLVAERARAHHEDPRPGHARLIPPVDQ